jgi:hypothetical protein
MTIKASKSNNSAGLGIGLVQPVLDVLIFFRNSAPCLAQSTP